MAYLIVEELWVPHGIRSSKLFTNLLTFSVMTVSW